jgi:hypothetical protein
LWGLRKVVRPAIMAKQRARLICPGSVSEFKTLKNLAMIFSIPRPRV